MSFTTIETQEQFDAVISERLKRDRESYAKRFEGWKSPEDIQKITEDYDAKIKALEAAATSTQQLLAEKDQKIAESEAYRADLVKTRIAIAAGLDIKYANRLTGETEEEWTADAAELAKDFKTAHTFAPLGNPEPTVTSDRATRAQFADWLAESLNN